MKLENSAGENDDDNDAPPKLTPETQSATAPSPTGCSQKPAAAAQNPGNNKNPLAMYRKKPANPADRPKFVYAPAKNKVENTIKTSSAMITVSKTKPLMVKPLPVPIAPAVAPPAPNAAAARINAALAQQKPASFVTVQKQPGGFENVFLSFISRQQGNDKKPKKVPEIDVRKKYYEVKPALTVVTQKKIDAMRNKNDVTKTNLTQNGNGVGNKDVTCNSKEANDKNVTHINDVKNKPESVTKTAVTKENDGKIPISDARVLEALKKLSKLETTVTSVEQNVDHKETKSRKSPEPKNVGKSGVQEVKTVPNINIISTHTIQPKSNGSSPMPILSKPENVPYTKHDTMPSLDPVPEVSQAKYVFRQQLHHGNIFSIDNTVANENPTDESNGNDLVQHDKSTTTEDSSSSENIVYDNTITLSNGQDSVQYISNDVGVVNSDVNFVTNNLNLLGNVNVVNNVLNNQISPSNVVGVVQNQVSVVDNAASAQITPSNVVTAVNNQINAVNLVAGSTNGVNVINNQLLSVVNVPYNVVNTMQTAHYGINNVYNVGVAPAQSLNVYTVQTNVVNGPTTLLQPVQPAVVEQPQVEVVKKVRKPNLIWSNQNYYRVNRCETEYKNFDRFYPMSMQPIVLMEDKLKLTVKSVEDKKVVVESIPELDVDEELLREIVDSNDDLNDENVSVKSNLQTCTEEKVIVEGLPELNADTEELLKTLSEDICSNDDSNQENISNNVKCNGKNRKSPKSPKKLNYNLKKMDSYPKIYEEMINKLENELNVRIDKKVTSENLKEPEYPRKEPLNVLEKFETFQEKFKESSICEYDEQSYVYSPKLGYLDKTTLPEVNGEPSLPEDINEKPTLPEETNGKTTLLQINEKITLPKINNKLTLKNKRTLKKKKFMKSIKIKNIRKSFKFLGGRKSKHSKDLLTPNLKRQIRKLTPLQARVRLDDVMVLFSPKLRRKLLNMDSCVIPRSHSSELCRLPTDEEDGPKIGWEYSSGKDPNSPRKVGLLFY